MPTHFVGRDKLVQELVERLITTGSVAISAEGLPGVGKTALAVALANDQKVRGVFPSYHGYECHVTGDV